MLQFDLSPLIGSKPGKRLDFSLDEGPRQLGDVGVSFLRGRVRFTRIQEGVLVEGSLETEVTVECIRCLTPFPYDMKLEMEETVGFAGRPRPDINYRLTDEGWFDVLPLIREQVWVAMPMKPLCRPDCRGLCPQCGANLNLETCTCQETGDPRLAVLAEFYEQSK